MPPRTPRRGETKLPILAVLALVALAGCSSTGDFGQLHDTFVTNDIHAWVGRDAAAHAGAPVSTNNLTDDERTLRDLAFALIEPPYDRQRWDAILYEYGIKRRFQRELWTFDPTAYYRHLLAAGFSSTTGRYDKLIDDIRNDVVRIGPFLDVAHRVVDIDHRREQSMHYIADLSPPERLNALARIGENSLTIAWVHQSLMQRCAGYRFALDHLVATEPENVAAEADLALRQLQQQVAADQLVPVPPFAARPPDVAAKGAPVIK